MKNNPGGCFGLGFLRSFLYLNQGRIAAGNFFDVCDLRQVKTVHSTSYGSTCGVDKIAMNTLKWVFIIAAATEMFVKSNAKGPQSLFILSKCQSKVYSPFRLHSWTT